MPWIPEPQQHRDEGGALPTQTTAAQSPLAQQQINYFASMSPEQLAETALRLGGSSQGQLVQRILQQKRLMGGGEQQQSQPAPPSASGPPQAYSLGGFAQGASRGGKATVPVVVAGGEYIIGPDQVRMIGGGDIKHGHKILDAFVLHVRKRTIKETSKLKGPVKS